MIVTNDEGYLVGDIKASIDSIVSSVRGKPVVASWLDSVWPDGKPVTFADFDPAVGDVPCYRYSACIAGEGYAAYAKRVVEEVNDVLIVEDIVTASHARLHPYNGGWKLELYLHRK